MMAGNGVADRAVARRYAEAFVNALGTSSRLEAGLQELKAAAQIYSGSKEFQRFMGSPEIAPEDKERLLDKLWSGAIGKEALSLLHLLLKKDRMEQLPAVVEEAKVVAERRQGLLRGRVITAYPISSAETGSIAQAVGRLLGKQVLLERSVDRKLLGGVRVEVGSTLFDGSVQSLLENVRRQLKAVKVV